MPASKTYDRINSPKGIANPERTKEAIEEKQLVKKGNKKYVPVIYTEEEKIGLSNMYGKVPDHMTDLSIGYIRSWKLPIWEVYDAMNIRNFSLMKGTLTSAENEYLWRCMHVMLADRILKLRSPYLAYQKRHTRAWQNEVLFNASSELWKICKRPTRISPSFACDMAMRTSLAIVKHQILSLTPLDPDILHYRGSRWYQEDPYYDVQEKLDMQTYNKKAVQEVGYMLEDLYNIEDGEKLARNIIAYPDNYKNVQTLVDFVKIRTKILVNGQIVQD